MRPPVIAWQLLFTLVSIEWFMWTERTAIGVGAKMHWGALYVFGIRLAIWRRAKIVRELICLAVDVAVYLEVDREGDDGTMAGQRRRILFRLGVLQRFDPRKPGHEMVVRRGRNG